MALTVRNARPEDDHAILRLTYHAFLTLDYPGRRRMDEHYLFALLRGSPWVIPELCFVAEKDGKIVGHILYVKSNFRRPDGALADTITFGPLSVLPAFHRQGIGRALVLRSLERAREMGHGAVLILGVPDYYPKLGFKRARDFNLTTAEGSDDDAFMAYELCPGYLSGGGRCGDWPPEYTLAETDDAGFEAFHRQFMRENFPGELILRPLFDRDILLMKRYLKADHVARWYQHPEDWIYEMENRHGAFGFITHMMAETNGVPIGFCQYYDCFYSRAYEGWGVDIPSSGVIFSLDYLIGEPEYLSKGFGKSMIEKALGILRAKGAKTVVARPDENNAASRRVLERCGFRPEGAHYRVDLSEVHV